MSYVNWIARLGWQRFSKILDRPDGARTKASTPVSASANLRTEMRRSVPEAYKHSHGSGHPLPFHRCGFFLQ